MAARPTPAPTPLALVTRTRLRLMRGLEALSDLRGNTAAGRMTLAPPVRPRPALWVYVSTIGELNAIEPLLRSLVQRLESLQLVLITDHDHYGASYRGQYPQAEVCFTLGHHADAQRLAQHYPPALLLVAEIPCLPSDAPCRFSVAFVAAAKRQGAAVVLANGWLYGQRPPCRMDRIERWLLQRDYVRAFDVLCMQLPEGHAAMLAAGADPARVVVAGNLKFDAMQRSHWRPEQARSPRLLGALLSAGRPVIVAGCVTNLDEQRLVLRAFVALRAQHPSALLVLAPRHPEVQERVQALVQVLKQHDLSHTMRSALVEDTLPAANACLVLDTMGDLRDFYAAATAAHVGVDHNVLEPMAFHKPVTVVAGWTANYPSYPVYALLRREGALTEVGDADVLAQAWGQAIGAANQAQASARAQVALAKVRGALQRHLDALEPWLERAARKPARSP
jgi:3-deoxy-D-manno-octulosonic-acid transferase